MIGRWLSIAYVIFVMLVPFWIPYQLIVSGKKKCGVSAVMIALALFAIYGYIFHILSILRNDDLPPEYFANEAFMFHVERTVGLNDFYTGTQKAFRDIAAQPWKYFRTDGALVWFAKNRETPMFPLALEVKAPGGNFDRSCVDENKECFTCSRWNENMRVEIDKSRLNRFIPDTTDGVWSIWFKGKFWGNYLFYVFASMFWIFPVATLAYMVRRKWLFFPLWGCVFALYGFTIHYFDRQVPALQRELCAPDRAVAVLNAPENRARLQALWREKTRVVENDPRRTIVNASVLCGGDFFPVRFLCWDLGNCRYLYYSPADLLHAGIVTDNARLVKMAADFYLASYPEVAAEINRVRLTFVFAQAVAGALWLLLFISALRRLRRPPAPAAATETQGSRH